MVTLRQPYREKVSQMVSWGHWFALFNMLLAMVLGSRYLFVADWPTTLAGRLFVRQPRRSLQLPGVYQLCADSLSR
jgi:membrane-anchored protein YejM (alkaline phosphatase superfamily)